MAIGFLVFMYAPGGSRRAIGVVCGVFGVCTVAFGFNHFLDLRGRPPLMQHYEIVRARRFRVAAQGNN